VHGVAVVLLMRCGMLLFLHELLHVQSIIVFAKLAFAAVAKATLITAYNVL
jgi:hypothetical protein